MTPDAPEPLVRSSRGSIGPANTSALQPPTTPSILPPSIPDHELLGCIGRGSYGGVWLARNKLGTYRAIKIVYRATFEDSRPFEREFKGIQKFEPISRSHEGLVDILQVGGTDEYFYYVMELADAAASSKSNTRDPTQNRNPNAEIGAPREPVRNSGFGISSEFDVRNSDFYAPRTLKADLQRLGRLPVDECVRIGLALGSALAHLHRHGLIHRDVKPSNIIFVNGVPKLADIGLVAEASEARSFVGTEGFIPPEGPGTPQADIYSLGKVLYEISTGHDRRDFPALPAEIEAQQDHSLERESLHRASNPTPTANSAPEAPRSALDQTTFLELNAVVVKACKSEPRQRYGFAQEMHADLELLQRGESVKRKRTVERRWAIATKTALVGAGLVLLCLATWLLSTAISSHAPRYERKLTANLDALNAYSQGRYAYNKNTDHEMTNAIRYFERATALDPNFAEAYAGLASSYQWLDYPTNLPKARVAAEKALKLNPKLAEAHKQLAIAKYVLDWRWADAEAEFKLAIRLDPGDGETLRAYGFYLKCMGRTKEAVTLATRAHELDPRSIATTRVLGEVFFAAGDYQQAIKLYQAVIEMEPKAPWARGFLAQAYEALGQFPRAIDLQQEEGVLSGQDPKAVTNWCDALRKAYHNDGPKGYWRVSLEWSKEDPPDTPCEIASLYARLGDKESVFEYLQIAFQERDVQLVHRLKTDRAFDKFRGEPEFIALLKKMKWE